MLTLRSEKFFGSGDFVIVINENSKYFYEYGFVTKFINEKYIVRLINSISPISFNFDEIDNIEYVLLHETYDGLSSHFGYNDDQDFTNQLIDKITRDSELSDEFNSLVYNTIMKYQNFFFERLKSKYL